MAPMGNSFLSSSAERPAIFPQVSPCPIFMKTHALWRRCCDVCRGLVTVILALLQSGPLCPADLCCLWLTVTPLDTVWAPDQCLCWRCVCSLFPECSRWLNIQSSEHTTVRLGCIELHSRWLHCIETILYSKSLLYLCFTFSIILILIELFNNTIKLTWMRHYME